MAQGREGSGVIPWAATDSSEKYGYLKYIERRRGIDNYSNWFGVKAKI